MARSSRAMPQVEQAIANALSLAVIRALNPEPNRESRATREPITRSRGPRQRALARPTKCFEFRLTIRQRNLHLLRCGSSARAAPHHAQGSHVKAPSAPNQSVAPQQMIQPFNDAISETEIDKG